MGSGGDGPAFDAGRRGAGPPVSSDSSWISPSTCAPEAGAGLATGIADLAVALGFADIAARSLAHSRRPEPDRSASIGRPRWTLHSTIAWPDSRRKARRGRVATLVDPRYNGSAANDCQTAAGTMMDPHDLKRLLEAVRLRDNTQSMSRPQQPGYARSRGDRRFSPRSTCIDFGPVADFPRSFSARERRRNESSRSSRLMARHKLGRAGHADLRRNRVPRSKAVFPEGVPENAVARTFHPGQPRRRRRARSSDGWSL